MDLSLYYQALKKRLEDNGVSPDAVNRILVREKATVEGADERDLAFLTGEQRMEILVASAVSRALLENERNSTPTPKEADLPEESDTIVTHSSQSQVTEKSIERTAFPEDSTVTVGTVTVGDTDVEGDTVRIPFTPSPKEANQVLPEAQDEQTRAFALADKLPSDTATIVISDATAKAQEEETRVLPPSVEKLLSESATIPISRHPSRPENAEEETLRVAYPIAEPNTPTVPSDPSHVNDDGQTAPFVPLSPTHDREEQTRAFSEYKSLSDNENNSLHILLNQPRPASPPSPSESDTVPPTKTASRQSATKPTASPTEPSAVKPKSTPTPSSDTAVLQQKLVNRHPRLLFLWLALLFWPTLLFFAVILAAVFVTINALLLAFLLLLSFFSLALFLLPALSAVYALLFTIHYGSIGDALSMIAELGVMLVSIGILLFLPLLYRSLGKLLALLKKALVTFNRKIALLLRNLVRLSCTEVVNL